jgi:hypothetical protein
MSKALVLGAAALAFSAASASAQVYTTPDYGYAEPGFLFPIHGFTPALGVGILACVILAVALFALYKELIFLEKPLLDMARQMYETGLVNVSIA